MQNEGLIQPVFPKEKTQNIFDISNTEQYFICVNCWSGSFAVCLVSTIGNGAYIELVKAYWFDKPQSDKVFHRIEKLLRKNPKARILINSSGYADLVIHALKLNNIKFDFVHWNGACFVKKNKEKYTNKKSQAYHHLSEAIGDGRFKISTSKHKDIIVDQLSKVGHEITQDKKYRITPHTADSASFVDNISYIFLEGVMGCGK